MGGRGTVYVIQVVTLAILSSLLVTAASSAAPPDLFPKGLEGWRAAERARYDRSHLFDFIDGGAEVYLAYDFRQVSVVTYRRKEAPDIAAEAYDMGAPQDAYGVLSIDLTGEKVEVGAEARYGAGLLRFCKGRWLVRVLAQQETKEARDAVIAIGRQMAGAINEESPRPGILKLLPPDGLVPDSATFFHTRITLNQLYYLSDENLLQLGPETNAVIADYKTTRGEVKLVLIRYPDAKVCMEAGSAFVTKYLRQKRAVPLRPGEVVVQPVEEGRFVGMTPRAPYLALVFEARGAAITRDLLTRAKERTAAGDKANASSR